MAGNCLPLKRRWPGIDTAEVIQTASVEPTREAVADRSQFREDDPRHHTARLKQMLTEVIDHAREDVSKVMDPRAQALFESTRKCSSGLERHTKITRKGPRSHGERQVEASYGPRSSHPFRTPGRVFGVCLLKAQIAQSRMVVRAPSKGPMEFAVGCFYGQLIDARMPG